MNRNKLILSVCDFSGRWSRPYAEAGYTVLRVDPKHPPGFQRMEDGGFSLQATAEQLMEDDGYLLDHLLSHQMIDTKVWGVLLAPPCTHFTISGAQYWKAKDEDGRTAEGLAIVDACLALVDHTKPKWWVLENPVGRLPKLRPRIGKPFYFQPHWYAGWSDDPESNRYTKRTGLWGDFNKDLVKKDLEPIRVCSQGSWIQRLGGSSERTKELRSMTPDGFARAFFESNP